MKKTLLSIAAAFMTMAMSAQTWTTEKWFNSVGQSQDGNPGSLHINAAQDGSVYATATYDSEFTFAGKTIANDDQMTSPYVAKFKADGTEEWAATLYGSATISAIATDAEGNAYIAGTFEDAVELTGTDGAKQTIESPLIISAYVAKLSASGVFEAVKTFSSEVNADIANILGDPWGEGFEMPIYDMSFNDPVYVRPLKLQVDGGKVYVSAQYVGDVTELGWKGAYLNYFDMMIFDLRSFGLLSLNAADLSDAKSVANVQTSGTVLYSDESTYPEDLVFAVDNGNIYTAFLGFGDVTLTTASGQEDFTLPAHSVVVSKIGGESKLFAASGHDKTFVTDNLKAMVAEGGKLYIGGAFYDKFPFDESADATAKGTDLYVAVLNASDLSVDWTVVSGYEETDPIQQTEVFSNLVVNNGQVYYNGLAVSNDRTNILTPLAFVVDANTHAQTQIATRDVDGDGQITSLDYEIYADVNDNGKGVTATLLNTGYIGVYDSPVSTAIQSVKATATSANEKVYNLQGQQVAAPQKGLYIVGGKKVVY